MLKQILVLLALLCLYQSSILNIDSSQSNFDSCFWLPLQKLESNPLYNYTITQAWTDEQAPLLRNGSLNTSDFIHVDGWTPYRSPYRFFIQIGKNTDDFEKELTAVKDVKHGSDAPEFGLSDADLFLAFGNPSKAKEYFVPSGKALILLRFQATVGGSPYIGRWSVFVDLVDEEDVEIEAYRQQRRINRLMKNNQLNPLDVTRALNILPAFVENSIFWTFSSSPATGTKAPVPYSAFLLVLRSGQQFLGGPIFDGQQGIVQVKDLLSSANRTQCHF